VLEASVQSLLVLEILDLSSHQDLGYLANGSLSYSVLVLSPTGEESSCSLLLSAIYTGFPQS